MSEPASTCERAPNGGAFQFPLRYTHHSARPTHQHVIDHPLAVTEWIVSDTAMEVRR